MEQWSDVSKTMLLPRIMHAHRENIQQRVTPSIAKLQTQGAGLEAADVEPCRSRQAQTIGVSTVGVGAGGPLRQRPIGCGRRACALGPGGAIRTRHNSVSIKNFLILRQLSLDGLDFCRRRIGGVGRKRKRTQFH